VFLPNRYYCLCQQVLSSLTTAFTTQYRPKSPWEPTDRRYSTLTCFL
jgi:hypothetical protein